MDRGIDLGQIRIEFVPTLIHEQVRAIGSLAQEVVDQGIPGVLGMRYSVFVVTAAQYIGQLYAALGKGRPFGEAAGEARKYLASNPERWVGLQPRPLQDWFVPVVYEAAPIHLLPPRDEESGLQFDQRPELDPVQTVRDLGPNPLKAAATHEGVAP